MDKIDVKELLETINDARKYLSELTLLEKELRLAEKQILSSADLADKTIDSVFREISNNFSIALRKRKTKLKADVLAIRDSSLLPLKCSLILIEDNLQETNKLIDLSKNIERFNAAEFTNKSRKLGSLPEVPELKEVSYISFQFDGKFQKHVCDLCDWFGSVSRIAPAQICSLIAKPGAILVEWEVLDTDEPYAEILEYHLEKGLGCGENVVFHDCYKGPELQYLVQDLNPDQNYSFRVRCKFEGSSEYSPWSIVQIGCTSIKPYSWAKQSSRFTLSIESKIVTPVDEVPATVLSDGPQFSVGNTLDFTFIDAGANLKDNFIGLIFLDEPCDCFNLDVSTEGTFLLEASGNVYIDGVVKSTKLPPVQNGSKVTFTCSAINDDKIRMNIDVSDKRVTYDWNVENSKPMHFVGKFSCSKWKVLVE